MAHPLEAIYALQEKDRRHEKLMRQFRDIPQRKKAVEARLNDLKQPLEQELEEKKKTESTLKQQELETNALREKISRYKMQQMEAQTNEQYRVFVREIAAVEQEIRVLENTEIRLMEDLERNQAVIAEYKQKLSEKQKDIAGELDELKEHSAYLQEQVEKAKADYQRAASTCDSVLLKKYKRIIDNKNDFAVVLVGSGGYCGGCHMKLPPQIIHDARNPSKIAACNFCGRMVYNPPYCE